VTVSEAGEEIRRRFGSERPDDEHPAA